jgi:hypothetical protein
MGGGGLPWGVANQQPVARSDWFSWGSSSFQLSFSEEFFFSRISIFEIS